MYSLALALHVISAIVWVGGMFFAHQVLRPAALSLDAPLRLTLWRDVFARFFPWVWVAVTLLPLTGYGMLFTVFGGFGSAPWTIHAMQLLGLLMIAVFLVVFFGPYRGLKSAVADKDFPAGAPHLAKIRKLVGFNIILGLLTAVIASGGRLF
jgi:uncharacterized membrane protein